MDDDSLLARVKLRTVRVEDIHIPDRFLQEDDDDQVAHADRIAATAEWTSYYFPPPECYWDDEGKCQLISGKARVKAAEALEWETITVIELPDMDSSLARLHEVASHFTQRSMTQLQKGNAFVEFVTRLAIENDGADDRVKALHTKGWRKSLPKGFVREWAGIFSVEPKTVYNWLNARDPNNPPRTNARSKKTVELVTTSTGDVPPLDEIPVWQQLCNTFTRAELDDQARFLKWLSDHKEQFQAAFNEAGKGSLTRRVSAGNATAGNSAAPH